MPGRLVWLGLSLLDAPCCENVTRFRPQWLTKKNRLFGDMPPPSNNPTCQRGKKKGRDPDFALRGEGGHAPQGLKSRNSLCYNALPAMTKTELQIALAEATQTNKRTAALFLDTLSSLAYKAIRKEGEFVLPGFGKLVKQKRKARMGINPKTLQKIKIPAKTVVKFRVAKAAKDAILGAKK
jgi:DNA-binding protein HU-beta